VNRNDQISLKEQLTQQDNNPTTLPGDRVEFETLISDTSAALLRAPIDDVSSTIEAAVERVRVFFGVELSALLSVHEDRPRLRMITASYADGMSQVGDDVDLAELFPWAFYKVVVEQDPFIARVSRLPPEAALDRASNEAMGVRSALAVPVLSGNRVSHVIVLNATDENRDWPDPFTQRLRVLGEMLVSALQRKTAFAALRDAEAHGREERARLAAAVDAAELGFSRWRTLDTPTFLDTRMRDLLGIGPGDEARLPDIWLSRIDAGARDLVRDCRRQVLAGEIERAATEYRYAHPSRGPIWLRHVWRRLSKDSQGSDAGRLVGAAQDITEPRQREEALKAAHDEVKNLRDRLERENIYLRREIAHVSGGDLVSGRSVAVTGALRLAEQVAATDSTVLLIGETGTGKERFATFIHEASARRRNHMVRVNCSAIPSALIESELFGREKGAYTGALSRQIGRFELAQGSTLLLDEIGDLPLEVQVKLLRVLQERTIERLGNPAAVGVDVRIIAATHRDLEAAVRHGTFRTDLYYRLNVFPIRVPPLRERLEDLPLLVEQLVEDLGRSMRKRFTSVERGSLEALARYPWPGNVRELRNVLERAMILSPGPTLTVNPPVAAILTDHVGAMADGADDRDLTHLERDHILRVLDETGWRIRGKKAAAEVLGLKPTTLEARMVKLGIHRPGGRRP